MLHMLLYLLHVIGMALIVGSALYLFMKRSAPIDQRKRPAVLMMSAAHTQLLTGFILFFLLLSEVNHAKIGMKMLLAVVVAILATQYRKTIAANEESSSWKITAILLSSIVTALIAFLWK